MKPGGGSKKGSAFERKCARDLSTWWYGNGECRLWRRPGSGLIKSLGINRHTGDIVPALNATPPPCPWPFHCELKHYSDIGLHRLITEPDKSFIKKVWIKANEEKRNDLSVILLLKENRKPELIFMEIETYTRLGLDAQEAQVVFGDAVGLPWATVRREAGCASSYLKNDNLNQGR